MAQKYIFIAILCAKILCVTWVLNSSFEEKKVTKGIGQKRAKKVSRIIWMAPNSSSQCNIKKMMLSQRKK